MSNWAQDYLVKEAAFQNRPSMGEMGGNVGKTFLLEAIKNFGKPPKPVPGTSASLVSSFIRELSRNLFKKGEATNAYELGFLTGSGLMVKQASPYPTPPWGRKAQKVKRRPANNAVA